MTGARFGDNGVPIERLDVSAYTVPTDSAESDGTYVWDKTTIVVVEVYAGGKKGIGYTYADVATGKLIETLLTNVVRGRNVMDVSGCWLEMTKAIRNLGRSGISSMAIAAIDSALWDLKARLLSLSSHCGPALHVHACCAVPNFRHMEYFHDHVRIEQIFFDGVLTPINGELHPDRSRPGMGLELKRADAEQYAI